MTRYARALGSKSSNARVPEESTPWKQMAKSGNEVGKSQPDVIDDENRSVMKTGITKAKFKVVKLAAAKPASPMKPLFKALKSSAQVKSLSGMNSDSEKPAAEADPIVAASCKAGKKQEESKSDAQKNADSTPSKKKRNRSKAQKAEEEADISISVKSEVEEADTTADAQEIPENSAAPTSKKNKKRNRSKANIDQQAPETTEEEVDAKSEIAEEAAAVSTEPSPKKKKRSKAKKGQQAPETIGEKVDAKSEIAAVQNTTDGSDAVKATAVSTEASLKKKKKRSKAKKGQQNQTNIQEDGDQSASTETEAVSADNEESEDAGASQKKAPAKGKKKTKQLISKDDVEPSANATKTRKRLTDSEKEQMNQIAIQKLHADRLVKIRQKMVDSGVPIEDIERKFNRIRRSIFKKLSNTQCRGCRSYGHVLKDCPSLASSSVNTKCYKCGLTDHTSRMCSIKAEIYTFAECFVCHQTGHLTRSCPNNPRGIYPKGGCCHFCNEVTHLARNCPNKNGVQPNDREEDDSVGNKVKPMAAMLDHSQSADADVTETTHRAPPVAKKGKKRVVKF